MASEEEYDEAQPVILLRRCRPWLEKNGPEPVESDKKNFSKRRRKGRRIGDRGPKDFVPSSLVPFGRVVMFGYIGWEIYRRISSWFDKGSTDHQDLMALDQDRQLVPGRQDGSRSLQPLAEPDPRTGMIMQQLVNKTGYPAWASNPVQPERVGQAVKQQYAPPERVRRGRKMVMMPREGIAPPLEWLEQQQQDDRKQEERSNMRPPSKKSTVPYRRMTLLERAARETGTRFDVADGSAEASTAQRRERIQQRRQQLREELGATAQ